MIVYGFEEDGSNHDQNTKTASAKGKGEKLQIQPREICGKDIRDTLLPPHHLKGSYQSRP